MNIATDPRSELGKMLDEYKKLGAQVKALTKVVARLNERVESLESDRDHEETLRMERLERGYE